MCIGGCDDVISRAPASTSKERYNRACRASRRGVGPVGHHLLGNQLRQPLHVDPLGDRAGRPARSKQCCPSARFRADNSASERTNERLLVHYSQHLRPSADESASSESDSVVPSGSVAVSVIARRCGTQSHTVAGGPSANASRPSMATIGPDAWHALILPGSYYETSWICWRRFAPSFCSRRTTQLAHSSRHSFSASSCGYTHYRAYRSVHLCREACGRSGLQRRWDLHGLVGVAHYSDQQVKEHDRDRNLKKNQRSNQPKPVCLSAEYSVHIGLAPKRGKEGGIGVSANHVQHVQGDGQLATLLDCIKVDVACRHSRETPMPNGGC